MELSTWNSREKRSRRGSDHARKARGANHFSQIAHHYDDKHDGEAKPIYNACASLVIEHADSRPDDVVLNLGTGTGLIALALAEDADYVVGRDISDGMIAQARSKADDSGIENAEFEYGSFRDPKYAGEVDIIVSNFALHHFRRGKTRSYRGHR